MNHRELCEELKKKITEERKITNEVLRMIIRVMERRAFLELGYASVFDLLTQGCGYSNAAAYRRIEAAKLLSAIPEVETKLESGVLNLTTLAKAQTLMKAQERATGNKITVEFRRAVVTEIESQSTDMAERSLLKMMPESKKHVLQERRAVIDAETTRHAINFTKEMSDDLKRLKSIHSHRFPNASDADIVALALKTLLTQTASAAEAKRVKKAEVGCTYKDEASGKICGSKYQVQMDHIFPQAKGGSDDPVNLRPLCRQHNLMMAEKHFGRIHMDKFRKY